MSTPASTSRSRAARSPPSTAARTYWDAGVKNVVVGGRPSYGPMQTPSGSRAARYYPLSELDLDIDTAILIGPQPDLLGDGVIPNRTNQEVFVIDGGISLRNQVREGETVPLQMQFEAADCRIFDTPLTFNNFTNLWKYAADAMWANPQLCVQKSTGFAKSKESIAKQAPEAVQLAAVNYSNIGVPNLSHSDEKIPIPLVDQPQPNIGPRTARPAMAFSELETTKQYRIKQGEQPATPPPAVKPAHKYNLTKNPRCTTQGPPCRKKI